MSTYQLHGEWSIDGTDDDLARTLEDLDRAAATIKEARAEIVQTLYDRHGHHSFDVDGVGRVEVRQGKKRSKWDTDQLLSRVRTALMLDARTGEVESELDAVLAVWNLPAPRTTVLKARGIDPDEYCESAPGSPSVRIVAP